ncbi:hypothetical protein ACFSTC_42980 [Nonomuraea ferruginea]
MPRRVERVHRERAGQLGGQLAQRPPVAGRGVEKDDRQAAPGAGVVDLLSRSP